jgi:hypothetical protein
MSTVKRLRATLQRYALFGQEQNDSCARRIGNVDFESKARISS